MKRFMDFMRHSYDSYYIQLPDGETVEATREECFAPSYDKKQRWYWDEEDFTMVVRLAPTDEGQAIGNYHASMLRAEERYREGRMACVWKGQPDCRQKCSMCGYCNWTSPDDCLVCELKCIECTLANKSQTVELDMYWNSDDNDYDGPQFEFEADIDIEREYEEKEMHETLKNALDELTDDERQLWDFLIDDMSEREIAPLLGISQMGVNKRKAKLFEKLAVNDALRAYYEEAYSDADVDD
jgi:RNA polymerase sigma factor (sigma-70 family)